MKIYVLTEEYCLDSEIIFEVVGTYKSEEQAIKAMKLRHEKNMSLRSWKLCDKDDINIEEDNNSMYVFETDADHYYLLKVEPILLQN